MPTELENRGKSIENEVEEINRADTWMLFCLILRKMGLDWRKCQIDFASMAFRTFLVLRKLLRLPGTAK